MTSTRPLALGTALLAALAAAAIIALASAPPAEAHGFCTPFAYEPNKFSGAGEIRGRGDHSCTELHTYINIQVCLQKEVNGQWSDVNCILDAESASTYIEAVSHTPCTRNAHSGKYRTRTYGFTSQTTIYSQDGHKNRHWSPAKTFNCP